MYDVCALGEFLIDFTPAGRSAAGGALFERNPGGGPANVLGALARLGGRGAFITKVGNDQFGHFLKKVLEENNITTEGMAFSEDVNTTLAFVHLDDSGDRSFSFYRKPGADIMLSPEDIKPDLIDHSKIFHFSSLSLTDEPARSATLAALEHTKRRGKLISYDPNWRPALWKSEAASKEGMLLGLKYADILKVSEAELEFLTGETDLAAGAAIFAKMGIKIVIVTLGPKGCFFYYKGGSGHIPTYDVKVVDTTGSGDAFLGGLLYSLSKCGMAPEEIPLEDFRNMMRFSNAVGSVCATGFGGIPAMPSLEKVKECMRSVPLLILD